LKNTLAGIRRRIEWLQHSALYSSHLPVCTLGIFDSFSTRIKHLRLPAADVFKKESRRDIIGFKQASSHYQCC